MASAASRWKIFRASSPEARQARARRERHDRGRSPTIRGPFGHTSTARACPARASEPDWHTCVRPDSSRPRTGAPPSRCRSTGHATPQPSEHGRSPTTSSSCRATGAATPRRRRPSNPLRSSTTRTCSIRQADAHRDDAQRSVPHRARRGHGPAATCVSRSPLVEAAWNRVVGRGGTPRLRRRSRVRHGRSVGPVATPSASALRHGPSERRLHAGRGGPAGGTARTPGDAASSWIRPDGPALAPRQQLFARAASPRAFETVAEGFLAGMIVALARRGAMALSRRGGLRSTASYSRLCAPRPP